MNLIFFNKSSNSFPDAGIKVSTVHTFIEIKQIYFIYQQNRFTVKKLTCKMQNENSFTDKRFLLTLKRNPLTIDRMRF